MIIELLAGVAAIGFGCRAVYLYLYRRRLRYLAQRAASQTARATGPPSSLWERATLAFAATPVGARLTRDLQQAGLALTALEYLCTLLVVGLVGQGLLLRLLPLGPWTAAALVLAAMQTGGAYYLGRRRERAVQRFEALLPDLVRLMANSLRAGRTIQQTVAALAAELPRPAAAVFRRAAHQMELRSGVEEALRELTRVMPSDELKWVELTLVVLHRSGGDLAQALDGIAATLDERAKARQTIQAIIGHHRRIALGLPLLGVAFVVGLGFLFRGFLSIYFTPVGAGLVGFFIISQLLVARVVTLVGRVEV